jgi:hypothetical protein
MAHEEVGMPYPRSLSRLLAIGLASTEIVCGGSSPTSAPTNPLPTVAPTPVVTAPTPLPPLSASCTHLGAGAQNARCPMEQASFQTQLDTSISMLRGQRPDLFGPGDQVTSTGQFIIGIIKNMDSMGLCAGWDGEELAVKNSDTFNDQYDILTSNNVVRFGKGSYRTTCYPAAFPLGSKQPAATPGCNLPPSSELTCDREVGKFVGDVDAAIGTVESQKPQLFDFTNTAVGTNNPQIVDRTGYINAVSTILLAKGYCVRFDGTELQVKNTSDFNEQYAIILSDGWVRRGDGAYRTTCWPSAF